MLAQQLLAAGHGYHQHQVLGLRSRAGTDRRLVRVCPNRWRVHVLLGPVVRCGALWCCVQ